MDIVSLAWTALIIFSFTRYGKEVDSRGTIY